MSYVNSVLQPGERVIMLGRLHWITYRNAILLAVLGVVLVTVESTMQMGDALISMTSIIFAVLVFVFFAYAWFMRWITEFAVTDKRVIYKRGFINRHTAEMNMDKVESVDVDQSVLGRMLDYGSIHVMGTGQGIEHLHYIAQPLALRNAIIAK
jgi:uncharacterized membrane protein YdbT with pleckstrin-like domain